MSGIKTPIYRKDIPDQPDLIEPFAAEVTSLPSFPFLLLLLLILILNPGKVLHRITPPQSGG